MKWIGRIRLAASLLGIASVLNAQDTSTVASPQMASLTLEEAIDLAKRNNPTFLQTMNDLGPAAWGVRAANANLFLPNANLAFFTAWQDAGQQRLGGATFPQPSVLLSQYQFSLSYTLNGQTLFQPGQRRAERRAAERRVDDAELTLENQVTSAYLEVLRLQARAEQAERELRRTQEHLRLAEAREQVGAGTRLETMQANVAQGRAQVALLQAQNAARVAKLRLVQAVGVQVPADQIELVSEFQVFEPDVELNELLQDALRANPSLVAARADQNAASSTVKVAKAAYFPTLSLRASWSGFAREETDPDASIAQSVSSQRQQTAATRELCTVFNDLFTATSLAVPPEFQNCQSFQFTPADSAALADQLIAQNDVFPFDFENEPVTLSASFSIPLFNGFDRQLEVEQAVAQRNDLNHEVRALELQLRADVTEAVHNLETAYQTVQLQDENVESAREELRLSQERYQLGAGTFLELLDSQTLAAQAEVDQIEAVFQFHQALATLEAAVGHSLGLSAGN
jgi:outer membrane protein